MNVLFVNPTGRIGGAENALLEVCAGVRELHPSWRLMAIVASDGPFVARARELGVDVRVLAFPPGLARLGDGGSRGHRQSRLTRAARYVPAVWPAWRYLVRLRSLFRELAPQIVHTNGLKMHLLAAWAKPPGAALVWHVHDYMTSRRLSARLMKRCAWACSAIVAPSRSVADDVGVLLGRQIPIRAIWNAVDLQRFSPDGDRLDLDGLAGLSPASAGVVRVGLVATFARWKGHETFLEAIALLPASLDVRAYVIGGAVYDTEESQLALVDLRAAADRLGLGARVGFTGFIEDPAAAIRALDVVVHASTEPEPFGLAIAEATACQRAVVVSYAGGAAEIVSAGLDALVFTPGDAAGLARAIRDLSEDSGLRERLGRAGRVTAERAFTRGRLAREVCGLYEDILSSSAARPFPRSIGEALGDSRRVSSNEASNT